MSQGIANVGVDAEVNQKWTLAKKIRRLRELRGMSQSELARASGLTQAAISRIEGGQVKEVKSEALGKLAAALNFSVDDLLHKERIIAAQGIYVTDPVNREIIEACRFLTDSRRKQVLEFARFMRYEQEGGSGRTRRGRKRQCTEDQEVTIKVKLPQDEKE